MNLTAPPTLVICVFLALYLQNLRVIGYLRTAVQTAPPKASEVTQPTTVSSLSSKSAEDPLAKETEFEFSNTGAMTCLLCARQFKTLDQLKRHNKESELHKARLLYCLPFDHSQSYLTCALFIF
jgi:hypothetical protein